MIVRMMAAGALLFVAAQEAWGQWNQTCDWLLVDYDERVARATTVPDRPMVEEARRAAELACWIGDVHAAEATLRRAVSSFGGLGRSDTPREWD